MQTRAIVREFDAEEGWGVLDAPELPGGCWVHYSHIDGTGFRALTAGQLVNVEYEDLLALYGPGAQQDGYAFRAIRVHS
ncbi:MULTISPECIES: cold shock domain-containing protein [unclassified Rhodococcus (in: high G+C Gram-positive bacteria)]|uniref:cold shock domain-containing protein n=1 Tax=unclassified Rhodococcus (in: high G+C Gram-positive bacteria) TaxID=192944 RepID=UPI0033953231